MEMGLKKNHTHRDLKALVRNPDFKTSGKMLWSLTGKCNLLNSTMLDVALVLREYIWCREHGPCLCAYKLMEFGVLL